MNKPIFIAEIKTQSPFGFKSKHCFAELMNVAINHGDWVSVHTNALWGGDFEAISFVRRNTNKPILAKGFHTTDDDIQKALDYGANYVLVVDRVPVKYLRECLMEFSNAEHVVGDTGIAKVFPSTLSTPKFVCNSRDLRTGLPKKMWELDRYTDMKLWTCQASGIKRMSDVQPNVQAFIVGEHLVEFCSELP